ncbi:MAG: protein translocase subunit SecD [Myxococcota bacterium]
MSLRTRCIWVGAVVVLSLWLAFPSFYTPAERSETAWIPDEGVNLGLDLQGGIHWLLRIDTETAVKQELEATRGQIQEAVQKAGDTADVEIDPKAGELRVTGDASALEAADKLLASGGTYERGAPASGGRVFRLTSAWRSQILKRGVSQAQEVLRRRVDALGVTEPVIAPQGEGRILVQMPGEIDPKRARGILESTTFLEFKPVLDAAPNAELLRARYPNGIPEDSEIVTARNDVGDVTEAFVVPRAAVLTGSMLEDARLNFDRRNSPIVTFQWNLEGTRLFREFTRTHINKRLAAIIDGRVVTAPVIRTEIGRRGQIEGSFTQQEAADLAVSLRSGALPIPLIVEQERSVGPALGADSIRRGVVSILVGGAAVVLFMVTYYQTAGAISVAALAVNLALILAIMGLAHATLTLPGIAGLVLTIGMAVDANVIIFERIREELREGRNLRTSVQIGFQRSTLTILDANITTMIAAIVLYQFGQGPVQGFGVTLGIGILASVFTALVVTRLLVDLILVRWPQRLRV